MTEVFPLAGKRIWVAGHRGMVGSAVVRRLAREDVTVLTADRATLDLTRQGQVEDWLKTQPAGCDRPRRGEGRRHSGEQYPAGGLPLSEPRD